MSKLTELEAARLSQDDAAGSEAHPAFSMRRVLSFASITAFGFLLGKFSGIVKEMVVSARFGLSADLDAYFLSAIVPTTINNIVAGSAITAAVLPTFARYLASGRRDEFWRVASLITNVVVLGSGALTILTMLLAGPIIAVLAPSYPAATQAVAASLLIVMMPTLLLGALLNMLMAMLNAMDRFTAPAAIFLALNLGIIGAVMLLSPNYGVYAVAWGFLIGVGLQVVIQLVELRREHPAYSWRIEWGHPALREVLIALVPISALAIVAQINSLVDRSMATALPEGSVGALNYADTILGSFYMIGTSLSIAVFPSLSRLAAANDLENTARTIASSLRVLIFVLAPISLLLIAFAAPTIGLLLGRGRFDVADVQMTAGPLATGAVGLLAIAALYMLQRVFYALSDNVTPFVVGAAMAAVHILLNSILMQYWGVAGIALSTSVTAMLSVLILLVVLYRRVQAIAVRDMLALLARCLILAAISTTIVAWLFSRMTPADEVLMRVAGVAFAVLGGCLYFLLAQWTHTRESEMLWQFGCQFLRLRSHRESAPE